MKAVSLLAAGEARVVDTREPQKQQGELLLKVEMVGLCGTDLNSFRGRNPLVIYPHVIGHEIAATVAEGCATIPKETRVTVSPSTNCGICASFRRRRFNACQANQTFGVQRDGALAEWISVLEGKIYPSRLSLKELCIVEPLTVGVHAVSRGRFPVEAAVSAVVSLQEASAILDKWSASPAAFTKIMVQVRS